MLEKIGLPAKPSLRGSNWAIDGSNCQGCSSHFTFINRKHHCRRCGGLFCNTCTRQRMVLRGQGDSPVRICGACKELEETTRFERRHAYKNRIAKGGSKRASKLDDNCTGSVLSNEATPPPPSEPNASTSIHGMDTDMGSTSPEDLRKKASYEKAKYRTLKGEGRPKEALQAFKRGRDLERKADALESSTRKARVSCRNPGDLHMTGGKDDLFSELRELGLSDMDIHEDRNQPGKLSLEGELLSLIQGGDGGETGGGGGSGGGAATESQVSVHKRKALSLKREGRIAEAKEELKAAKVLERQLEERRILDGAEDSDHEMDELIRAVGSDPALVSDGGGLDLDSLVVKGADFDANPDVTDNDLVDPEFVSMLEAIGWAVDPETRPESVDTDVVPMVPGDKKGAENGPRSKDASRSRLVTQRELLALKRRALALKREGRFDEAEEELKKGKILEADLGDVSAGSGPCPGPSRGDVSGVSQVAHYTVTDEEMNDLSYDAALKNLGWNDQIALVPEDRTVGSTVPEPVHVRVGRRRSKREVQRELLGVKRMALTLRRRGEITEAEELLEKAKALEAEMEECDTVTITSVGTKQHMNSIGQIDPRHPQTQIVEPYRSDNVYAAVSHVGVDNQAGPTFSVSQKSHREAILAHKRRAVALKREGKLPEARHELQQAKLLESCFEVDTRNTEEGAPYTPSTKPEKPISGQERLKLQQESLGHKRAALRLQREGREEEAEAELRIGKKLEAQLAHDMSGTLGDSSVVEVENFLDPELVHALKEVGIDDIGSLPETLGGPTRVDPRSGGENDHERLQMEEMCKSEKINARNLKQMGKHREALDALSRAKMMRRNYNL